MASVASQLKRKSLHMRKVTVSRMRERYAQTILTFRITYVCTHNNLSTQSIAKKKSPKSGHYKYIDPKMSHAKFLWPFSLDSGQSALFHNPSSLSSTKHPTTPYRIQSTYRQPRTGWTPSSLWAPCIHYHLPTWSTYWTSWPSPKAASYLPGIHFNIILQTIQSTKCALTDCC